MAIIHCMSKLPFKQQVPGYVINHYSNYHQCVKTNLREQQMSSLRLVNQYFHVEQAPDIPRCWHFCEVPLIINPAPIREGLMPSYSLTCMSIHVRFTVCHTDVTSHNILMLWNTIFMVHVNDSCMVTSIPTIYSFTSHLQPDMPMQ